MTKLTKQQRRLIADQRFGCIDWQLPLNSDQIGNMLAGLPERWVDEDIAAWIERVRLASTRRFSGITEIVRHAAADAEFSNAVLYTEDESFRISIQQLTEGIEVKVEALGLAVEKYAHCTIGISNRNPDDGFIAIVLLDAVGDGTMVFENNIHTRNLLLNPEISPIIGIITKIFA